MPKKKLSVLKRASQSLRRNLRNRSVKSNVKTLVRRLHDAIASGDKEAVKTAFVKAQKVLSSAASKGVMHSNTASRSISRLAKRANAIINGEAA